GLRVEALAQKPTAIRRPVPYSLDVRWPASKWRFVSRTVGRLRIERARLVDGNVFGPGKTDPAAVSRPERTATAFEREPSGVRFIKQPDVGLVMDPAAHCHLTAVWRNARIGSHISIVVGRCSECPQIAPGSVEPLVLGGRCALSVSDQPRAGDGEES